MAAGVAALVLLLVGAGWALHLASTYARIGGTYIAKQYCSCLFVAGRSEASCRAEFEPDIDRFTLTVDRAALPARASVTTRLSMVEGRASYAAGFGCTVSK